MNKKILVLAVVLLQAFSVYAQLKVTCSKQWKEHQAIDNGFYTICYVNDIEQPGYATWTLTVENTENKVARKDCFKENTQVKKATALPSDYVKSGYDKGHMVPCRDFMFSNEAMESTFLMSNMSPQTHSFNAGPWKTFESYDTDLAKEFGSVQVIVGPIFVKGKKVEYIGTTTKIAVPHAFFRVYYNKENKFLECYVIPHFEKSDWASIKTDDNYKKAVLDYIKLQFKSDLMNISKLTGLEFKKVK